jgi:hypothetical protein
MSGDLKRLGVVPEVTTKGCNVAASAYNTAKTYVPAPLQEPLTKMEERVAVASAPLVAQAQDKGSELLKIVDSQVRPKTTPTQSSLQRRASIGNCPNR